MCLFNISVKNHHKHTKQLLSNYILSHYACQIFRHVFGDDTIIYIFKVYFKSMHLPESSRFVS